MAMETRWQLMLTINFWQSITKLIWLPENLVYENHIQRILHGRTEIQNFSSSVEKYFMSERSEQVKYFFNTRKEISYLQAAM